LAELITQRVKGGGQPDGGCGSWHVHERSDTCGGESSHGVGSAGALL
jgi:hypothetical protein